MSKPGFQPFGYAGGLYEVETGLVRFGARDYDPSAGRWMTKDPLVFRGRQGNLYAYVRGDPVNRVDPTGQDFEEWFLRNGNYVAAGVAAVAIAPLAIVGGLEVLGAAGAAETAFAGATTTSTTEAVTVGSQELIVAAGRSAAGLPFSTAEGAALRTLFGQGASGALSQLGTLVQLPEGLSADLLLRYAVLARAIIEAGKDTVDTQEARLKLIEEALKLCK